MLAEWLNDECLQQARAAANLSERTRRKKRFDYWFDTRSICSFAR
jgi:hypothetical protein